MIRFNENLRGEAIYATGQCAASFAQEKPFSVMIAGGKGEIIFKRVAGEWHETILTVDRCFGVMKSKPRKLKL